MALPDIAKKDFSTELQLAIPESLSLADSRGLDEAILFLLGLEKKCRTNNDFNTLKEVCLHMIRLCRDRNDWDKLNSTLMVINKRRAQGKVAVTAIVEEAMGYIEQTPNQSEKIALIKTLMEVCEGKIYVEAESARLHLMLAFIHEHNSDIALACDTIQDVHVETYGSISREEKAEYILHQTRLNLLNKDFVRALIQSRKMNRKTIDEAPFQSVKVKFYTLMVEYHSHEKDAWEIAQCYYKIYDTAQVQKEKAQHEQALKNCISFLLLSPHDNQRNDMLHRLRLLKDVQMLPSFARLLTLFTTNEVIPFPFEHQDEVQEAIASTQSEENVALTQHFIGLLVTRVTEHNIREMKGYFSRVHEDRMCKMLGLTADQLEGHLSEMSARGDVYVKVDRPRGIISFVEPSSAEEVLSDWAYSVSSMLSLMESTCHLINRENMVHKL